MNPHERRALTAFAARFAVVFVGALMPIPWLPDGYVTVIGRATNAALGVTDAGRSVEVRFEPPSRISKEGSWKATVHVLDRESYEAATFHLDARSFSYRPMVTFIALAAATSIAGLRRKLAVWAGGLLSMFLVTTGFSALPLLSRFAVAGALGHVPGLVVRTVYQATATPVMTYLLPVAVWGLWIYVTRPLAPSLGNQGGTEADSAAVARSHTNAL